MRVRIPGPPTPVVVGVLAFVQLVGTIGTLHFHGMRPTILAIALALAGPALLVLRGRWPGPMIAGIGAVTVVYTELGYPGGPIYLSLVFGIIFAALGRARWWNAGTIAGLLGVMIFSALVFDGPYTARGIGTWCAWMLVIALIGEALRSGADRRAERRAEREAAEREAARRRDDEKRLELARDIHDIVGHSLSMINVRAGVALHLAESDPEQVRDSLHAIKSSSKEALVEIRELLGVLRDDAPRAPSLDLARIDSLADDASNSGVPTRAHVDVPRPPGAEIEAVAVRVVQEALTNTVRHAAPCSASVTLTQDSGGLHVRIEDDGPGLAGATPGNGLTGMRERVEGIGGRLTIADTPSGVVVTANLPEVPA